jgi:hypothetical protein
MVPGFGRQGGCLPFHPVTCPAGVGPSPRFTTSSAISNSPGSPSQTSLARCRVSAKGRGLTPLILSPSGMLSRRGAADWIQRSGWRTCCGGFQRRRRRTCTSYSPATGNPRRPEIARADWISRTDHPASASADGNHVLHRTLTVNASRLSEYLTEVFKPGDPTDDTALIRAERNREWAEHFFDVSVTRGTTTGGCVDQGKLAAWTRMRVYPC